MSNGNDKGNFKLPQGGRAGIYITIIMFAIFFMFNSLSKNVNEKEVSYSVFLEYLEEDYVEEVEILDQKKVRGRLKNGLGNNNYAYIKSVIPYPDENLMSLLHENDINVWGGSDSNLLRVKPGFMKKVLW